MDQGQGGSSIKKVHFNTNGPIQQLESSELQDQLEESTTASTLSDAENDQLQIQLEESTTSSTLSDVENDHLQRQLESLETESNSSSTLSDVENNDDGDEYEVEEILGHKKFKGEYLYLLKWKGYSDADNTWEPATHLYCSDLLEKYITEHNLFGKNDKTEVSREEIKLSQRKQEGKGSLKLYPNSKLISNSQESYLTTAVSGNGRVVNCATTLEKKVKTGQTNSELLVHIKLSNLCPCGNFHKRRSMQALLNHSLWCINHDHTYFTTQEVRSSTVSQSTNASCSSHLMLKNRIINSSYGLSHSHIEIPSDDSDLASTANKSTDISKSTASYDLKLYLSPSSSTLTASETETGDLDDNSDSDGLFHPISSLPCAHAFVGKRQVLDAKSRWKGPMPLPRSFSKKQPHQARLKTKAAKVVQNCGECVTSGTRNTSEKGKTKVPISTQLVSLNGTKHVSEKPKSEKPKYVVPILKISPYEKSMSHKLAIDAAYKEVLMNWQFALNEQRGGTDNIIIVENEVDRVLPPTNFKYASSNIYRSGVPDPSSEEMSSSLCGCECYFLGRKCGPKSEYCCARMAGSTFAYTPRGKLCVPPGTPIYECNTKCTCPMDCPNRIVQLGRQFPLTIFRTRGRGWGVKTTQPIKVNTFVSEYVGEVINNEEAERRGVQCDAQGITYLFDLDFEDDCSAFTVDAANYGNISHFFNHSCDPNLLVFSVWIDTLDKRLPRLAFFTSRNISAGEELTFDYQMSRNRDYTNVSGSRTPCLCGSKSCYGYID